jgi:DNA-binding transcriptional MerR regulator
MSVNLGKLRIGEVHTLLRKDYPDIELSKIRYYEDKGLVLPARSPKGYRLYSDRDVACLREAIRLAQEEFVPLRVVRVRLIEQGLLNDVDTTTSARHAAREALSNVISIPAPVAAPSASPAPVRPSLSVLRTGPAPGASASSQPSLSSSQYLAQNEFLKTVGLSEDVVMQLHSLGLITPAIVANEVVFTNLDVRVANAVNVLLARGVDVRLLGSLRRNAEREVCVVEDLTQPLRVPGSQVSAENAHDVVAGVATEVAALRALLLDRALGEYLGR